MGLWSISVKLIPGWKDEGWPSILKSLYGFVWLGFGLDILLRFLALSYNAVEWGDDSPRLVAQNVGTVNSALAYCGLFWLLLSTAYRFAVRRKGAGPLGIARTFSLDFVCAAALPVALLSSVLFYLTDGPATVVPLALVTPLSLVAYLYLVPATIVWWDHFRQPVPKWHAAGIDLLVLMPALVHGWRSPYRENLAPVFFIPLLAALFAGRRPALRKLVPAALLSFLAVTTFVTGYRSVKWDNARPEEVVSEVRSAGLVEWLTGSWGDQMKRFHSFDSMLLTVQLVPRAKPYSGRSVLVAPFLRGFIPRFIYGDKGVYDAGKRFGVEIWGYDNPVFRDHGGAAIAPSMPGDLYESGGVVDIVLGALIWGALLGWVDGWKAHLPIYCAAGITALVATHCAMSVERDFDHSVAGLVQIFLLLIVVAWLVALVRRRSSDFSIQFDPTLERSSGV